MPATPKREGRTPVRPGARFVTDVVADNVRDSRLTQRLSQDGLATEMRELGHAWTGVTVSEVEAGMRNLTVEELVALARLLNAGLVDLFDPTGIAGRKSDPVDVGTGTVGAVGFRHWLRGAVRWVTDGPYASRLDAIPGHEAESDEAAADFDEAIRARSTDAVPPPERPDVDRAVPRPRRKKSWITDDKKEQD